MNLYNKVLIKLYLQRYNQSDHKDASISLQYIFGV